MTNPSDVHNGVTSATCDVRGSLGQAVPADGRAPRDDRAARDIERGVMRLLRSHGMVGVAQMPLPDGRRADIAAIGADGRIVIVEIKSCLADFRADAKWEHYRAFADAIYFAVDAAFPADVIPVTAGLILADRFGGSFERAGDEHPLNAARRKAIVIRIARTAAARLHASTDPDVDGWVE
ncbi:MAG: MmcB family DNA repair protein [Hyphomicrobiaceae bacterium]|nr:MmcB family DNA repair protein [Hyphomicrobiaceae bacterium]